MFNSLTVFRKSKKTNETKREVVKMSDDSNSISMPVGRLGIIGMPGTEEITAKVDSYLAKWREEREEETSDRPHFIGYCRDSYKIRSACPRFATGEAKGELKESARGLDLYILVDVFNYGVTYKLYGQDVPMSPDDHFQDLKRIIAAAGDKTLDTVGLPTVANLAGTVFLGVIVGKRVVPPFASTGVGPGNQTVVDAQTATAPGA